MEDERSTLGEETQKTDTVVKSPALKDLLGLPLDEEKDPDKLRNMVKYLWGLLDDIDTLDDAVKENSEWFRTRTYAVQQKRHRILTSDGYGLFLPKEKQP